jgi:hypothetical protein
MRRGVVALVVLVVLAGAGVGIALAMSGSSSFPMEAACLDTGDRLTKIQLLEHVPRPPHILILGSSRARPAIPAVLEGLTGKIVFNAGVQSGQASDEYVFTRLLAQKFPSVRPAYLIFVDVLIAADGVHPEMADEPLARPFLGSAAKNVRTACTPSREYTPYGGIAYPPPSKAQREQTVASELPGVLANIPADAKVPRHIDPAHTKWFEKLLTFINREGATPVIVLNPIYPKVLAARLHYGFPALKAAKTYLAWLHKHYRYVLVNAENIKTWGGKASDFSNIDHIDRANMSRLLQYIVRHSNGVLTKR